MTSDLQILTKLSKTAKITLSLVLCITGLLFHCEDIEENPGSRYSSLTSCHWNLTALTV